VLNQTVLSVKGNPVFDDVVLGHRYAQKVELVRQQVSWIEGSRRHRPVRRLLQAAPQSQ
jgi:hypothetical protein